MRFQEIVDFFSLLFFHKLIQARGQERWAIERIIAPFCRWRQVFFLHRFGFFSVSFILNFRISFFFFNSILLGRVYYFLSISLIYFHRRFTSFIFINIHKHIIFHFSAYQFTDSSSLVRLKSKKQNIPPKRASTKWKFNEMISTVGYVSTFETNPCFACAALNVDRRLLFAT